MRCSKAEHRGSSVILAPSGRLDAKELSVLLRKLEAWENQPDYPRRKDAIKSRN